MKNCELHDIIDPYRPVFYSFLVMLHRDTLLKVLAVYHAHAIAKHESVDGGYAAIISRVTSPSLRAKPPADRHEEEMDRH